ncbi:hypothetical protein IMSAGC011_02652 [Lachnospiraceae bacterium]|nr:hypothetical protein IMSAGC011_02652 [Lachnospiraceae bacterium]
MSFGARRVEIMAEIRIMRIVIDFTKIYTYQNFEWRDSIWKEQRERVKEKLLHWDYA